MSTIEHPRSESSANHRGDDTFLLSFRRWRNKDIGSIGKLHSATQNRTIPSRHRNQAFIELRSQAHWALPVDCLPLAEDGTDPASDPSRGEYMPDKIGSFGNQVA